MRAIQFAQSPFVRGALGMLVALIFLVAHGVASSALLHHWLHDDCDSTEHYCQVTTLSKGQETPVNPAAVPPRESESSPALSAPARAPLRVPRFLLLPERAPPLSA